MVSSSRSTCHASLAPDAGWGASDVADPVPAVVAVPPRWRPVRSPSPLPSRGTITTAAATASAATTARTRTTDRRPAGCGRAPYGTARFGTPGGTPRGGEGGPPGPGPGPGRLDTPGGRPGGGGNGPVRTP